MAERFVSRGFTGPRRASDAGTAARIPPGQYLTDDFPVLSAGPTPVIGLDQWSFSIEGLVRAPKSWSWEQFEALPARDWTVDISCVTKWTKLDTRWMGVSVETLFEQVEPDATARFVTAHSYGGYTTNLPLTDLVDGRAFVAYRYDGAPLEPAHGGPARLLVPH
ncbi:MAG: molybdopterin-dependent oxidoreductase, partial [Chloroflexi bacterium]|nr:molybdopterin-dependent oxidoreductase [Chloroflexota bacterium]